MPVVPEKRGAGEVSRGELHHSKSTNGGPWELITFQPPEAARRTIPRLANIHASTILRVEAKNDSNTTIPYSRFSKSDNVELHGLGSSINYLVRRVASCTTRDAKEIAKPLAMVP